jgi:hypothetical protein
MLLLSCLSQPLEDEVVTISRAQGSLKITSLNEENYA